MSLRERHHLLYLEPVVSQVGSLQQQLEMRCNGCWSELEPKSKCIATACGHLYCKLTGASSPYFADLLCQRLHAEQHLELARRLCLCKPATLPQTLPACPSDERHAVLSTGFKCAQSIVESEDSACPICENVITKRYFLCMCQTWPLLQQLQSGLHCVQLHSCT